MTSIVIETQFVSAIRYDENNVSTPQAWDKELFVMDWTGLDYSTFFQLNYEPSRNLYHIIESDQSITVLSDPSEDTRMQYVADNADAIWNWILDEEARVEADLAAEAAIRQAELEAQADS